MDCVAIRIEWRLSHPVPNAVSVDAGSSAAICEVDIEDTAGGLEQSIGLGSDVLEQLPVFFLPLPNKSLSFLR